ncbi:MAG TPA: DNA alkylation repair protein [Candidatus Moranbacteria bacterium]|nr:DNA alkylation repair protein [Candidatus Moranbacteria bacterium]
MNYSRIKKEFELNSNKERAFKMAAYMRNKFQFYGIAAEDRRGVYKEDLKKQKKISSIDWSFIQVCWNDEHREFQYTALDYLLVKQDLLTFSDISKVKKYIKQKQWWDTIDNLHGIIGCIGSTDERVGPLMLKWSRDNDFWVRRIAINHQLNKKEKTDTVLLEKILVNNFGSDEFFVNKAIGWSLREYSKTNPDWVKKFIHTHKDRMSKLSVKEASKYI